MFAEEYEQCTCMACCRTVDLGAFCIIRMYLCMLGLWPGKPNEHEACLLTNATNLFSGASKERKGTYLYTLIWSRDCDHLRGVSSTQVAGRVNMWLHAKTLYYGSGGDRGSHI